MSRNEINDAKSQDGAETFSDANAGAGGHARDLHRRELFPTTQTKEDGSSNSGTYTRTTTTETFTTEIVSGSLASDPDSLSNRSESRRTLSEGGNENDETEHRGTAPLLDGSGSGRIFSEGGNENDETEHDETNISDQIEEIGDHLKAPDNRDIDGPVGERDVENVQSTSILDAKPFFGSELTVDEAITGLMIGFFFPLGLVTIFGMARLGAAKIAGSASGYSNSQLTFL